MPFSEMWHIYKKKIFHRLLFGLLTNSEQGFGLSKQRDIIPDNGCRHQYLWWIEAGFAYTQLHIFQERFVEVCSVIQDYIWWLKNTLFSLHLLLRIKNIVQAIEQI